MMCKAVLTTNPKKPAKTRTKAISKLSKRIIKDHQHKTELTKAVFTAMPETTFTMTALMLMIHLKMAISHMLKERKNSCRSHVALRRQMIG